MSAVVSCAVETTIGVVDPCDELRNTERPCGRSPVEKMAS